MNRIIIMGRLCADPELRHTQNGIAVATGCVAVDRNVKGEQAVDFINIVAWRRTGEFLSQYFHKGNRILVEGSLQIRPYTDKTGAKRTAAEVIADHVEFCESKKTERAEPAEDTFTEIVDDGELPF